MLSIGGKGGERTYAAVAPEGVNRFSKKRYNCQLLPEHVSLRGCCHTAKMTETAPGRGSVHRVRKKGATLVFAITLPNPNRSSKFFYHHT